MTDAGTCPRCGRAGSMRDLGGGLVWCEDCNVGWTDEDDLDDPADEPDSAGGTGTDGTCCCGRDDRIDHHQFGPGCDAWTDDMTDPADQNLLDRRGICFRHPATPLGSNVCYPAHLAPVAPPLHRHLEDRTPL